MESNAARRREGCSRGTTLLKRVYFALSPLPLAGFVLGVRYATETTEGWGLWATIASLGETLIGLSAVLGAGGVVLAIWLRFRGEAVLGTVLATLLAGSVFLLAIFQMSVGR